MRKWRSGNVERDGRFYREKVEEREKWRFGNGEGDRRF